MRIVLHRPAPAVSPGIAVLGGILAAGTVLYALLWMAMAL